MGIFNRWRDIPPATIWIQAFLFFIVFIFRGCGDAVIDRFVPPRSEFAETLEGFFRWYSSWGWALLAAISILLIFYMYSKLADESSAKRKLITRFRTILTRAHTYEIKLSTIKTVSYEDIVGFCENLLEYAELRAYLGQPPPNVHRTIAITQTGEKYAYLEWLKNSIDDLEKQWGLVHKHKKLR